MTVVRNILTGKEKKKRTLALGKKIDSATLALLQKILVENSSGRITIPDIKKERWYNKPPKIGGIPDSPRGFSKHILSNLDFSQMNSASSEEKVKFSRS